AEYVALGLLASAAALLLATGAAWGLVRFFFESRFAVPAAQLSVTAAAIVALTVLVGLWTSAEVVRKPPLEVLGAEEIYWKGRESPGARLHPHLRAQRRARRGHARLFAAGGRLRELRGQGPRRAEEGEGRQEGRLRPAEGRDHRPARRDGGRRGRAGRGGARGAQGGGR